MDPDLGRAVQARGVVPRSIDLIAVRGLIERDHAPVRELARAGPLRAGGVGALGDEREASGPAPALARLGQVDRRLGCAPAEREPAVDDLAVADRLPPSAPERDLDHPERAARSRDLGVERRLIRPRSHVVRLDVAGPHHDAASDEVRGLVAPRGCAVADHEVELDPDVPGVVRTASEEGRDQADEEQS